MISKYPFLLLRSIVCSSFRTAVILLKWKFRCAMEAGIFTSLINKIISRLTAGMPSIDLEGDFYSLCFFYSSSQANKATGSPRVKMLWGRGNKDYSLELSLKLSFKRPREKYRLQRNPTRFLYSKEKVFPFWCLKSSLQCWMSAWKFSDEIILRSV